MPLFKYKVADTSGKITELLIEGDTQADSLTRLRQRGFTPIANLGEVDSLARAAGPLWQKHKFDAYDFTTRLVPLLKAQIPIERALGIVAEGMDDGPGKHIVVEIRRGLHEGKRLSALIRNHGNRFPNMYANMVEAGEESGSLPAVMEELLHFMANTREMKEFLITSSIYPMIVLLVTCGVVVMIFSFFIPKFSKIFLDMGRTPPLPMQVMMGISNIVINFWWLWLLLIIAAALLVKSIAKGGKARPWWDEFSLKIPLIGSLMHMIEITRFLRTLAVLIQNHVHLLDTVNIASRVIQNSHIFKSLTGVASELRGGARLSAALAKSEFVPKTAVRMLGIGEETGNMGEMLDQVASQYETNLKNQVKRVLALFEPAVILILAVVVLSVVLSMFFSIMGLNNLR